MKLRRGFLPVDALCENRNARFLPFSHEIDQSLVEMDGSSLFSKLVCSVERRPH